MPLRKPNGKKEAAGSGSGNSITVTGLGFFPRHIVIEGNSPNSQAHYRRFRLGNVDEFSRHGIGSSYSGGAFLTSHSEYIYVNTDGFNCPKLDFPSDTMFSWYAYE